MTLKDLRREHPEKVCICRPHLRDIGSGQVRSWFCMQVFDSVDDARDALEHMESSLGVRDAVLIFPDGDTPMKGDLAARYYRVYHGLER